MHSTVLTMQETFHKSVDNVLLDHTLLSLPQGKWS